MEPFGQVKMQSLRANGWTPATAYLVRSNGGDGQKHAITTNGKVENLNSTKVRTKFSFRLKSALQVQHGRKGMYTHCPLFRQAPELRIHGSVPGMSWSQMWPN